MARRTAGSGQRRQVVCYLCNHAFEVSGMTQSTSCPGCNKPVLVADQHIKSGVRGPMREIRTCGRVFVGKRARLIAERVEAHSGIEIQGTVEAQAVVSGETVKLGPKAVYKGALRAPRLVVEAGAKLAWSEVEVSGQSTIGDAASPVG